MSSEKSAGWEPSQLRRYDLSLEQIPRLHFEDPKVDELMAENVSCFMLVILPVINMLL